MAGSASFNNLGAMSSGPADLFGLMASNFTSDRIFADGDISHRGR